MLTKVEGAGVFSFMRSKVFERVYNMPALLTEPNAAPTTLEGSSHTAAPFTSNYRLSTQRNQIQVNNIVQMTYLPAKECWSCAKFSSNNGNTNYMSMSVGLCEDLHSYHYSSFGFPEFNQVDNVFMLDVVQCHNFSLGNVELLTDFDCKVCTQQAVRHAYRQMRRDNTQQHS
jgi:hypothetical protein